MTTTSPALDAPIRSPERAALEIAVKTLRMAARFDAGPFCPIARTALDRIETLVPEAAEWGGE